MRTMICAIALMGAALAAAAATATASSRMPAISHGFVQDGGFGRGYGVFHSYGWARGSAGYGLGDCYWHPDACEASSD